MQVSKVVMGRRGLGEVLLPRASDASVVDLVSVSTWACWLWLELTSRTTWTVTLS